MEDKINFIISSKNRDTNINPSPSAIDIIVPQGLLYLQSDEQFYLNVVNFSCFKNFYNCQAGHNDTFQLIYTDINNNSNISTYNLQTGNFDIYQMVDYLNTTLTSNINFQYDTIKNILLMTRTSVIDNTHQKLYLNLINCQAFFGFSDNTTSILLPYNQIVSSTQPINVNGDNSLLVEITGDISIQSSLDNLNNTQFLHSKVIFMKSIDVSPTGLLTYNNTDGGDSFQFRLNNNENINWFRLSVYNEKYQIIPNMNDYVIILQFIKRKRDNLQVLYLTQILEYVRYLFMLFANQIFKINI